MIQVPPVELGPQDAFRLPAPSQHPPPDWSWICVTFGAMPKGSSAWPLKTGNGRRTSGSPSAVSRPALPVQPAGAPPA